MRPETKLINFDIPEKKRDFQQWAGRQTGVWEITAKQRQYQRTPNQNKYYHAAIVSEWTMWIREEYGDPSITHTQAHEALKKIILGTRDKPLPNGEVIEIIPDSHNMEVEEFSLYIQKCIVFLSEWCSIEALSSEEYNAEKETKQRGKAA